MIIFKHGFYLTHAFHKHPNIVRRTHMENGEKKDSLHIHNLLEAMLCRKHEKTEKR